MYGVLKFPGSLIKLGLYWEEILTFVVFFGAVLAILEQRRWTLSYRMHIAFTDLFAIFQVILVIIQAFISWYSYPNLQGVDLIRGLRDQLIYIVVYFVGRSTVPNDSQGWLILRSFVIITIIISVLGFIERFLIPIDFFLLIGAPEFFSNVVGHTFPDASLGLPENFWTSVGGYTVRRMTSVYTSSQPLAIGLMLLLPPLLWLLTQKHVSNQLHLPVSSRTIFLLIVIVVATLVSTITRANIAIGLIQICLAIFLLRTNMWKINRRLLRLWGLILLAALIIFSIAYQPIVSFVQSTVKFTESSSNLHLQSLITDYQYLLNHPFGRGISTSGVTSNRVVDKFEDVPSSEGQYSKLIREMGLPGFIFYLGILSGVTSCAYIVFLRHKKEKHSITGISFTILLAGIAFLFNSVTTEWHGALSTSLPFWWLAGTVTTLSFYKKTYASSSS
jgi:hypothetical protein